MVKPILGVEIGRKISRSNKIRRQDVDSFAAVSGDNNPLHMDAEYAARTRFKQPIAHGALSSSFISAVLAQVADPQVTVLYLTQNLRFRRPVFLDDTITTTVEVVSVNDQKHQASLTTVCVNQNGEQVLVGDAEIMLDPYPFEG